MKKRIFILSAVLIPAVLWVWHGNSTVELTEYEIEADIPNAFDGFTIVQVSDLHNCTLGTNNKKVLDKIKEATPDIIVMTGDIIDARNTKVDVALAFAEEALKIAPCYYVSGNHEARIDYDGDVYENFRDALSGLGVTVLENENCDIIKNGEEITLVGLKDGGFDYSRTLDDMLNEAMCENENYKILLAHRPEYFDLYQDVDLIFSGHAHGGQVRLPFIGGLFAPGQGVLPKYDGGIYTEDERCMVVSRGVGNSLFPIRINNKPEIVAVKLKTKG